MNRRTVGVLLVAVLGILALSLAAATLSDTVTTGTGGGGAADEPVGPNLPSMDEEQLPQLFDVSFPQEFAIAILLIVAISLLYYAVTQPLEFGGLLAIVVLIVAIAFVILSLINAPEETAEQLMGNQSRQNGSVFGGGEGPGSGGGGEMTTLQPPELVELLLVFVLGLAFVGVVLSLFRSRQSAADVEAEEEEDDADIEALSRAAGRAADRIEANADVDNEVYRAWREMTDLLDVPRPESSTAGQFAAAAVDAGMDADDVAQLTAVFEEVRYGGAAPSRDREQRAIDAFRRIEQTAEAP